MLFLDEFTEFRRDAIEGRRQPLEDVSLERLVGMDLPPGIGWPSSAEGLRIRSVEGGSRGWQTVCLRGRRRSSVVGGLWAARPAVLTRTGGPESARIRLVRTS